MNKVVGLVGAISGLATLDGAQAASLQSPNTTGLPPAQSFAELIDPIPNALAVLQAMDAEQAAAPDANVTLVQYHHHHHHRWRHHHHHHRWWRRHHHHHHHHRYR